MRHALFGLMLATALSAPNLAVAADNTVVGVGSGAVAGALVGGPIGAVVGAVVGGVVGSSTERARAPRRRYSRAARHRRQAAASPRPAQTPVRVAQRGGEPARSGPTATGATGTPWQDPH